MKTLVNLLCAVIPIAILADEPKEKLYVTIVGECFGARQQKIKWVAELTVMKVVLMSGGISWHVPRNAIIVRGAERIEVPFRAIFDGTGPDVKLLPGDRLEAGKVAANPPPF